MHLSGITYQTFWDGTLGIEAKVGAEEAPSFSPSDLVSLVQFTGRMYPVRRFVLNQTLERLTDEADRAAFVGIRSMVEQFCVETDGDHYPILPFSPPFTITHITSKPWLHFPSFIVIFDLDDEGDPKLSKEAMSSPLVGRFVKGESVRAAFDWLRKRPPSEWSLWNIWTHSKPRLSVDLTTLDLGNPKPKETR